MILVGLTGGIGSGKSTVSGLLAARGAVIVDADRIVHELQAPGTPVLAAIVERFGEEVAPGGVLDRPALARRVFGDADALRSLNAIVHPAVAAEMTARIERERSTDHVVVLDIPLLVESPWRYDLQAVIVVDVPVELQVRRLVEARGFDEDDARARIARQATREQRRAAATHIIDNSGAIADLDGQVGELWAALRALPPAPPPSPAPAAPPADPNGRSSR